MHDRRFGQALLVFLDPQPALVLGDKTAALFHNQVHGWFPQLCGMGRERARTNEICPRPIPTESIDAAR
jgi:hypothetical protein